MDQSTKQVFRFAGVELRPEESTKDKIRDLARGDLWKSSVRSILVGAALALVLVFLHKLLIESIALAELRQPGPYPYFTHGLLFFYIGWALYWGMHGCLNAHLMDDQHGVNRFLGGLWGGLRRARLDRVDWAAYAAAAASIILLVVYSLLGGGIYEFCREIRRFVEPR